MRKESIIEMIDKRIIESFVNGYSEDWIVEDINSRINKMSDFVKLQKIDVNTDWNNLTKVDFSSKNLSNTRIKYTIFYINHSKKRIDDINWIMSKRNIFNGLSKSELFKLVKFKEKVLERTELPF